MGRGMGLGYGGVHKLLFLAIMLFVLYSSQSYAKAVTQNNVYAKLELSTGVTQGFEGGTSNSAIKLSTSKFSNGIAYGIEVGAQVSDNFAIGLFMQSTSNVCTKSYQWSETGQIGSQANSDVSDSVVTTIHNAEVHRATHKQEGIKWHMEHLTNIQRQEYDARVQWEKWMAGRREALATRLPADNPAWGGKKEERMGRANEKMQQNLREAREKFGIVTEVVTEAVKVHDKEVPAVKMAQVTKHEEIKEEAKLKNNTHTFMLNGSYFLPAIHSMRPYITGGVGVTLHEFKVLKGRDNAGSLVIKAEKKSNTSLAWSIGAGVAYPINNKLSLSASVRYFDYGKVTSSKVLITHINNTSIGGISTNLSSFLFTAGVTYKF
ncbi:hypothetical protein MIDIC_230085 [Alphaproteobacteria bacterium]